MVSSRTAPNPVWQRRSDERTLVFTAPRTGADGGSVKVAARSRAEWQRLVDELGHSGSGTVEFARRRGVNPKTLAWWRSHLRRDAEATGVVRFLRVVRMEPLPRATPEQAAIVIELDNIRVSVHRGVDAATLATVLVALGGEHIR